MEVKFEQCVSDRLGDDVGVCLLAGIVLNTQPHPACFETPF